MCVYRYKISNDAKNRCDTDSRTLVWKHISHIIVTDNVIAYAEKVTHNIGRRLGHPRGFGDLGRMAIYFQGAGEHWYLF